MHTYKAKGINDLIAEFPGGSSIVEEYGISCGPCTVGICQLKDILKIHRLAKEAEEEIYPEQNIDVSPRYRRS